MLCYSLFRNNPRFIAIPAGSTLFFEGEPSDLMYVLIVGEAKISIDGREIERLRQGAIVGEMALVDHQARAETVEAITDCEFVCVDEERLEFLVAHTPGFALEMMRVMARRWGAADWLAGQFVPRAQPRDGESAAR
jgi:CRP-like cAMP-binding protein